MNENQRVPAAAHFLYGSFRDHMYAVFSAIIATGFAILLGQWLSSGNLVLIYVLAVMIVGLRHGAGPAMTTVALAFLSFDFFLAEPIFGFFPTQQDDIAAMVFLVVIALLCGAAASHLRRQFFLLNESNRYTETLRSLGQKLTIADTDRSVWLTLAGELGRVLQTEVCIVAPEGERGQCFYPEPTVPFNQLDRQAIEWASKNLVVAGRLSNTLDTSAWSLFPVINAGKSIAVAAIHFDNTVSRLTAYDSNLITAMLQLTTDAWQRIQLASKLEAAHLKTEVEQLRSALLSSVSHDLKSPLSAMIGAAETLNLHNSQLETTDRKELTDTILQESRRLESYIQNLLDMTRLGHGSMNIKRDWVSVDDIIGGALTRLKRYFPGIAAEYHSDKSAPLLYAQAVLIEQAVYNILENAAKFTPAGARIRIRVELEDNNCLINIEDRGPGIPESLREKIFDMFYAVSDGDHKNQNTGMGLAICRGMIVAHGGKVSVHAGSDNNGTCFVIQLPMDKPISVETE
jgi:two-component system sensor histidine kinase KdpD